MKISMNLEACCFNLGPILVTSLFFTSKLNNAVFQNFTSSISTFPAILNKKVPGLKWGKLYGILGNLRNFKKVEKLPYTCTWL
jgi:hypothetical protein